MGGCLGGGGCCLKDQELARKPARPPRFIHAHVGTFDYLPYQSVPPFTSRCTGKHAPIDGLLHPHGFGC